jgi:uncharacterized peroxidase-related enzyme
MAHLPNPSGFPGIGGLFAYRPETARPLRELAQQLLRGASSLSPGERELIATFVSSKNACRYCTRSHAAVARKLLSPEVVDAVLTDVETAPITPKLRALLAIANAVRGPVGVVPEALMAAARDLGATDLEVHDTVLVAAAFCMFNRYVDALGADTPDDGPGYEQGAVRLTEQGYVPK